MVDDGPWVDKASAGPPEAVFFDDIGWLMELTHEHVVLSSSMGKALMGPRLRIPAGMVRSIHEFDVQDGKPVTVPRKPAAKRARKAR